MPGLKTRKRIKKQNTAPVMMMSAEPSVFRPHAHSDPSSEGQSQPRRMTNPALQLKRARSAQSFSDIALQRLSSYPSTRPAPIQKNDERNGTATTTSPSSTDTSPGQNTSSSVPQDEIDRIVETQTAHLPNAEDMKLNVGEVKQNADKLTRQEDELTKGNPAMKEMFRLSITDGAHEDGGGAVDLSPPSSQGGTNQQQSYTQQRTDMNSDSGRGRRGRGEAVTTLVAPEKVGEYVDQQSQIAAQHNSSARQDKATTGYMLTSMAVPTISGQAGVHLVGETARMGGQITAIAQLFIAPIDALVNARAIKRSLVKAADLKKIAKRAKQSGYDPELVDAIEYAIRRKKGKAIARAITLATNLLTIGTASAVVAGMGLIALLSNPVGWGALSILAATGLAITAGVTLYYIGKWAWKKWKGTLGVVRREMATTIFNQLRANNPHAQAAIRVLMGERKGGEMADTARIREDQAVFTLIEEQRRLEEEKNELEKQDPDATNSDIQDQITQYETKIAKIQQELEIIHMSQGRQSLRLMEIGNTLQSQEQQLDTLTAQRDNIVDQLALVANLSSWNPFGKKKKLLKKLNKVSKKITKLEKKKEQTERARDWKKRSKMDRTSIKRIERKLKNW